MPPSHNAVFRDPTEAVGNDARPQYPLTGPYVFWDTRDWDHGPTGFTAIPPGGPGPHLSTGSIPNLGSAGSIADLVVEQESVGTPGFAEYSSAASLDSSEILSQPLTTAQRDAFLGGGPSLGPYCWIAATGPDLNDSRMIDATGFIREFITARFNIRPMFPDGTWTSQSAVELNYDSGTPPVLDIDWGNGFWAAVAANGGLETDMSMQRDVGIDLSTYSGQLDNKLMIDMQDIVNGTVDLYFNDVWMLDVNDCNITNTTTELFDDWWGLNQDPASPQRDLERSGSGVTAFASAQRVDSSYQTIDTFLFDLGQWTFYNSVPVEGEPWPGWRAWGLWRGVPSAADIAAIKTMMGI